MPHVVPATGYRHERIHDDMTLATCAAPVTGYTHERSRDDDINLAHCSAPETECERNWTSCESSTADMEAIAAETGPWYVGFASTGYGRAFPGRAPPRGRWARRLIRSCSLQSAHAATLTHRVAGTTMEDQCEILALPLRASCGAELPREPEEPGSQTTARVDLNSSSSPPAQSISEADEWGAQHQRNDHVGPYTEDEDSYV